MAMRQEVAACNPCLKISKKVRKKIPARNKRDRFMSLEEEDQLFRSGLVGARAHFRPVVRLGVHLEQDLANLWQPSVLTSIFFEFFLRQVKKQRSVSKG